MSQEKKQSVLLIFITVLLFLFVGSGIVAIGGMLLKINPLSSLVIKSVSAQEIYPLFQCPCCGKPIDTGCCGMAEERKKYVDALSQGRLSKEKVISAYVKKYGTDSFIDKNQKEEFRKKLVKSAPAKRPIIAINPLSYDFGDVSQKKGIAITLFEVENKGKKDLVINKLETSCGCTSASVVFEGKEGPKFSMSGHGVNEAIEDWQVTIAPGKKAKLKVYYDPSMHEDFRGLAIREIYIYSNDPIDFEKKVKIELNQID